MRIANAAARYASTLRVEAPPAPSWLPDAARDCWELVAPELVAMRVLTKALRQMLVRYCCAWSRWIYYEQKAIENPNDDRAHGKANSLADTMLRLEREMGLTPAARARAQALAGEDQEDKKDRFIA